MINLYEKYIRWWLAEYGAVSEYESLMIIYSELNTRLAKYAARVDQGKMTTAINFDKPRDIELV